jgi:fido (protein-threonine AMPylation protein)
MALAPGYGETPLDPEEADALTAQARELLGDDLRKADLYEILPDYFLRDLHQKLYGDIWTWAGRFRTRELNIGIPPEQIAAALRTSLENARHRWEHRGLDAARIRNRRAR